MELEGVLAERLAGEAAALEVAVEPDEYVHIYTEGQWGLVTLRTSAGRRAVRGLGFKGEAAGKLALERLREEVLGHG